MIWWALALIIRNADLIPIWYDQRQTFIQVGRHLLTPYDTPGFVNPPWTAALLLPIGWLPLEVATLLQASLYFAILTGIIFKFGGGLRATLITVTSFIAFDAVLELNIDWLVCLGLLIPIRWSMPLLVIKPQNALGYYLAAKPRDLLVAVVVLIALVLVSLLVWGWWPEPLLANIGRYSLGRAYNLAPVSLMPWPIAVVIGVGIAWLALRRRDPVLGILGGLFFAPYITLYSLLLPLALIALRWPRLAIVVSLALWIVYGGALFLGLRQI
jgi:hypothetical protein